MSTVAYPNFDELKAEVREAGLLERVPVRGSIEMIAILLSLVVLYSTATMWNPFLLGLFMTLIFTRAVFVSHDILHTQYFKNKSLSMKLSYPFSAIILSNSSSWWDFKHNINHHTYCNIVTKDEDIMALDGAFTPNHKGNSPFLKKYKHIIFWGAMFFMYPAFIAQSYSFALKRKKYGEFFLMLLHWPIIWGSMFYILPFTDALIVYLTLNFTLSPWLAFGFITNHLGCEVFELEEGKDGEIFKYTQDVDTPDIDAFFETLETTKTKIDEESIKGSDPASPSTGVTGGTGANNTDSPFGNLS